MALLRDNKYYRITYVNTTTKTIDYCIYANENDRQSEVDGTLFYIPKKGQIRTDLNINDGMADNTKSILNNVLTAGYTAMKATETFSDAEDV